jgi:hypothetical protein
MNRSFDAMIEAGSSKEQAMAAELRNLAQILAYLDVHEDCEGERDEIVERLEKLSDSLAE